MRHLQKIIGVIILSIVFYACSSSPVKELVQSKEKKEEPVVIANDSLEYQVIIFDIGFNSFLNSVAKPEGFYSQPYLEARNRAWVINWNNRARNPHQFNANIYENIIDYQATIDYGYEVNYKLFNYFLFAQRKYKMNLGGGFRGNRIN